MAAQPIGGTRAVKRGVQAVENLKAKVKKYKPKSADDLNRYWQAELKVEMRSMIRDLRKSIATHIPKRKGSEPGRHDKRQLAEEGGICSNDFLVDKGNFDVALLDTVAPMMEGSDPRKIDEKKALAMIDRCDDLVNRYGNTGECSVTYDGEKETVKMANVVQGCTMMRVFSANKK